MCGISANERSVYDHVIVWPGGQVEDLVQLLMFLTLSHLRLPIIPEMNSREALQTEDIDERDVSEE